MFAVVFLYLGRMKRNQLLFQNIPVALNAQQNMLVIVSNMHSM